MGLLRAIAWAVVKHLIHRQFPDIHSLSTRELAEWLAQSESEPPLLLDARTPEEYEVSHLPKARLPPRDLQELSQGLDRTGSPAIVIYCSVCYRSAVLAQQLQAMGYKQVFNLEGSVFEWVNEGHPVYQGNQVVQLVHPFNRIWGVLLNPEIPQVLKKA
jgi:rhodanese-related sulfurtransferase